MNAPSVHSVWIDPAPRRTPDDEGSTLVELLAAIVLLSVVALGVSMYLGNLPAQGNTAVKARNAQSLNELVSSTIGLGGTIAVGPANNIDTTTAATAIACLNTGFTVNGVPVKCLPPIAHPSSYTVSGTPPNITFGYVAASTFLP